MTRGRARALIGVAAALAVAAYVGAVSVPSANAFVSLQDPLTSASCLLTGCETGPGGDLVGGGRGMGVLDFLEGGATSEQVAAMATEYPAIEAGVGLAVAPEATATLATVVLTTAAYVYSARIGNAVSSYVEHWTSHFGTLDGTTTSLWVGAQWGYSTNVCDSFSNCYGSAYVLTAKINTGTVRGVLYYADCGATGQVVCGNTSSDAVMLDHAGFVFMHSTEAGYGVEVARKDGSGNPFCLSSAGVTGVCGGTDPNGKVFNNPEYLRYSPYQQFVTSLLKPDSWAPYQGQAVNGTYAWPNPATGAGVHIEGSAPVLDATSLGGSPTPCVMVGGSQQCGSSIPTSGTVSIPALNSASTATKNLVRSAVDPREYVAPTISGGTFTDSGGRNTATYPMPSCAGQTLAGCEAWVTSGAVGARLAVPDFTVVTLGGGAVVPQYGPGAVVTTSPGAWATVSADTDVTVYVNPDPLPLIVLAPKPWETGSQYAARMAAVGIKVALQVASVVDAGSGPQEVLDPSTWPGSRPGDPVTTTTTVTVMVNPITAPVPDGDPNPAPGTSTDGGGGTSTPPDVGTGTPLHLPPITSPCGKFPFGIFCWITAQFDAINEALPVPWHLEVASWPIPQSGGMLFPSFAWDFANPGDKALPFIQQLTGSGLDGQGGVFGLLRRALSYMLWLWGLWVYAKRKLSARGLPDGDGSLPEAVES